jgi:hypothetical protein
MTKKEFLRVATYLTAGCGKEMSQVQADVYFDMLNDLPADAVMAAVKKVLAENIFPTLPTVGAIRQAAAQITQPYLPSHAEAWGLVIQAISRYGYYRELEGISSLPPDVRRVVMWIGWKELCTNEHPDVIRGQFRMMYEQNETKIQESNVLPASISQLINKTVDLLPAPKAEIKYLPPEKAVDIQEKLDNIRALINGVELEDDEKSRKRMRETLNKYRHYLPAELEPEQRTVPQIVSDNPLLDELTAAEKSGDNAKVNQILVQINKSNSKNNALR